MADNVFSGMSTGGRAAMDPALIARLTGGQYQNRQGYDFTRYSPSDAGWAFVNNTRQTGTGDNFELSEDPSQGMFVQDLGNNRVALYDRQGNWLQDDAANEYGGHKLLLKGIGAAALMYGGVNALNGMLGGGASAGSGLYSGINPAGAFTPATLEAGMAGAGQLGYGAASAASMATAAGTGLTSVASAAEKIVSAAKAAGSAVGDFLGTNAGKALVQALGPLAGAAVASALTKKASAPDPDPMMQDAAAGAKNVADKAVGRADSQDAYFNSTFMPQYLEMMKRADARDTELYDFNMGRARLAAGQMDKFYEMVDSYDSEGERTKRRGEAIATVQQRDAAMMSGASRELQRMGVNPNSGVWASNLRQMGQQSALNQAMAANMVGEAARREGINLRAQAAGLRGADSAYAAGALAGSGLGMAGVTGAQNGWGANNAGWNATTGLGLTGYGQLGTYGTAMTGYRNQANIANVTGRNQMMGMGLGFGLNSLFGAGGMFGPSPTGKG